jgi:hypothetical protein
MVFRIVVIWLNYGRPKYVIKLSEFDHSQCWENRTWRAQFPQRNSNYAPWASFATPRRLLQNLHIFAFLHIH